MCWHVACADIWRIRSLLGSASLGDDDFVVTVAAWLVSSHQSAFVAWNPDQSPLYSANGIMFLAAEADFYHFPRGTDISVRPLLYLSELMDEISSLFEIVQFQSLEELLSWSFCSLLALAKVKLLSWSEISSKFSNCIAKWKVRWFMGSFTSFCSPALMQSHAPPTELLLFVLFFLYCKIISLSAAERFPGSFPSDKVVPCFFWTEGNIMEGSGQNWGDSNQSQQRGERGWNAGREKIEETY